MRLTNWRDDLKFLAIIAIATTVGNGCALIFILWWKS